MEKNLLNPIAYLEKSDFSKDGNLLPSVTMGKPVLVMFQANYCGHCTSAKPEFQKLANSKFVNCMTIQGDGQKSERDIMSMIDKIYPGFRGYPSYLLFINNTRIPYDGRNRSADALRRFVYKFL
jgi:thiol-disulfide isomerase/thioredoxin